MYRGTLTRPAFISVPAQATRMTQGQQCTPKAFLLTSSPCSRVEFLDRKGKILGSFCRSEGVWEARLKDFPPLVICFHRVHLSQNSYRGDPPPRCRLSGECKCHLHQSSLLLSPALLLRNPAYASAPHSVNKANARPRIHNAH